MQHIVIENDLLPGDEVFFIWTNEKTIFPLKLKKGAIEAIIIRVENEGGSIMYKIEHEGKIYSVLSSRAARTEKELGEKLLSFKEKNVVFLKKGNPSQS